MGHGEVSTDFKAKYGLAAEPIVTFAELLEVQGPFVRLDTGKPPSLDEVQEELSLIVLIPTVPEDVRRTFGLAKRLHLFGWIEYGLFTVSEHYSFLALEAAVYSRWTKTLPNPVRVQVKSDPPFDVISPTHYKLFEIWKSCERKLKVEGEPFPNTVEKVIGRLQAEGIITADERVRMSAAMELRNSLSHLEFAQVFSPGDCSLWLVAEFINSMFDR